MVTQKRLKEIKYSLKSVFSMYNSASEVEKSIDKYTSSYITSIYTDSKCQEIYYKAINDLKNDIKQKYESIAAEINRYISTINETLQPDGDYTPTNSDDLKNIAIGAGIGLGAAIIFSGPVGWLIGFGAIFGGVYNSSKKRKELVEKIAETANELNTKAIKSIRDVLNVLIVPDPSKVLEFKKLPDPQTVEEAEILTKEQSKIRRILQKRNIKYLVHFSDAEAKHSILKNGIVSVAEARRRGISIRIKDDSISANRTNFLKKSSSDDYISLSVTRLNVDLLAAYRSKSRMAISRAVVFYIDANILWKEIGHDRLYCNMNEASRDVSFGNDTNDFEKMFDDCIIQNKYMTGLESFYRSGLKENEPTHPQAEILFEKCIDPSYIVKVEEI